MREWCGCGAGIVGKPKRVKKWRDTHRHPGEVREIDSDTERNEDQASGISVIGFRPNP